MIWFYLVPILFGLVTAYFTMRDMGWPGILFGLVIGGMVGIMGAMLANGIATPFVDTHYEKHSVQDLQNISSDSEISGGFFLFAGYVDEDAVFRYYAKDSNGVSRLGTVYAWEAEIVEGPGQPRVEVLDEVSDNRLLSIIEEDDEAKVVFYIPEGSIKQSYTLGGK